MAAGSSYQAHTLSDIEDSEGEMSGKGSSAVTQPLSGSGDIEAAYQPHEYFFFGKVAVPKDAPILLRISLNLIPLSIVVGLIGLGVFVLGMTPLLNSDPDDVTGETVVIVFRIVGPIVMVIGVFLSVSMIYLICKGKQYIKTGWETEKELDKARRRAREKSKKYAMSMQ